MQTLPAMYYTYKTKVISTAKSIKSKSEKAITQMLSHARLAKSDNEVVVKTKYGFKLKLHGKPLRGMERILFRNATYDEGVIEIMRLVLQAGDQFVDIGSGVGLNSGFASIAVGETGQVFSFEPDPEKRFLLEHNVALNNLRNVRIFDTTLGSENKMEKVFVKRNINRIADTLMRVIRETDYREAETKRLDEFAAKFNNLKLIRINAGAELNEVANGFGNILESKNAPVLIADFIRPNGKEQLLQSFFRWITVVYGYRVYKLAGGSRIPSKLVEITKERDMPVHDFIFCFLPSHFKTMSTSVFEVSPLT